MTIARRNLGLPDIPRSQLRAEWRFTDYGDTTVRDWGGGGRNMAVNGPTWNSNAGMIFNGSSAYLGAAGAGVVVFSSTTTFSAIVAMQCSAVNGSVIGAASNGAIQVLVDANGKFAVNKSNTVVIGASNTVITNRWCICGVSYDGTTISFYKDGMSDGSATNVQNFAVTNSYIGKRNHTGTEFFGGEIAYILAYDRVLTQPEHEYASQNIARYLGIAPVKTRRLWLAPTGGGSTYVDTGTCASIAKASTVDQFNAVDTALPKSVTALSGATLWSMVDTVKPIVIARVNGVDSLTNVDTGKPIVTSRVNGIEFVNSFDIGLVRGIWNVSGVDSFTGSATYIDTGLAISITRASGLDVVLSTDIGLARAVFRLSGSDAVPSTTPMLTMPTKIVIVNSGETQVIINDS